MASSSTSSTAPRKKFVGRPARGTQRLAGGQANRIPDAIAQNPALNAAIATLPTNYSFEIHKTIHHITKSQSKMVALQMPEGLLLYACTIADIIERFTDATTIIMGDVTYGACCIDDYSALAMGCDLLVHYGHSCLVPIDATKIKTLYVFVEISVDSKHLVDTIRLNFPPDKTQFQQELTRQEESRNSVPTGDPILSLRTLQLECEDSTAESQDQTSTRLAIMSTIQFTSSLQTLRDHLGEFDERTLREEKDSSTHFSLLIPRSMPLSPGELLGCTAPRLSEVDALLYIGDGRFHLEAAMIANPSVPAFRYDPYSKKLTREFYNHVEMRSVRQTSIEDARNSLGAAERQPAWGVVLGTLGRQGNFRQYEAIVNLVSGRAPVVKICLSELSPAKLRLMGSEIAAFVQTSCPRLSIDWGYAFDKPLLSPYEATVALGSMVGWWEGETNETQTTYHMDFYTSGSPWSRARTHGFL